MGNPRGQVASEYLAMYGWALFAMFAVVAVLVSTGMLGAGRFSSEECVFAPNLPCNSGYFKTDPAAPGGVIAALNITNTQGFPMYITECHVRLVGGKEDLDWWGGEAKCERFVPQGDSFQHEFPLSSSQRVVPSSMRRAYVTYTFRNCQDLDQGRCFAERAVHNTSGRLVAQIRG